MPKRSARGEGRRKAVNTKVTDVIREKLDEAAAAAGRTLSNEIERRLESSFDREDVFFEIFGREHVSLLKAVVDALRYAVEEMNEEPGAEAKDYNQERQLCAVLVGLAQGLSETPANELLRQVRMDSIWLDSAARAVARFRRITPFHAEALVARPGDKAAAEAAANFKLPTLEEILRR
jgi:hypothetical protein